MKTSLGTNDDYACMAVEGNGEYEFGNDDSKLSFYYGYEVTKNNEEDSEWMFQVSRNGEVLKQYTTSELEKNSSDKLYKPMQYLMVGINMYLDWVGIL